jgi:hypothetical protein
VLGAAGWLAAQGGEQAGDLVAGERDLSWWRGPAGVFGGGGDGEEGQRDHGEGDPAVPGGPGADLVLIEPGQALARLGGVDRAARCQPGLVLFRAVSRRTGRARFPGISALQ